MDPLFLANHRVRIALPGVDQWEVAAQNNDVTVAWGVRRMPTMVAVKTLPSFMYKVGMESRGRPHG